VALTPADDPQDMLLNSQPAAGGNASGAALSARQMARQISSFRLRISEGGMGDEDNETEEIAIAGSSTAVQQSPFMAVAGASNSSQKQA
jgi:hypothetical protein